MPYTGYEETLILKTSDKVLSKRDMQTQKFDGELCKK